MIRNLRITSFSSLLVLILSIFITTDCLGMDKIPDKDHFAWIEQEFTAPNTQAKLLDSANATDSNPQTNKPNQFVLDWGTDKTKLFEKYININIQRAAVICGSTVLAVFSAKLIMQKNPSYKAFFGLGAFLTSIIYNKDLVKILNTKTGKAVFVMVLLGYLHKEIAKTLLTKEIFNLIYKK